MRSMPLILNYKEPLFNLSVQKAVYVLSSAQCSGFRRFQFIDPAGLEWAFEMIDLLKIFVRSIGTDVNESIEGGFFPPSSGRNR
jgi:hypothetical protein